LVYETILGVEIRDTHKSQRAHKAQKARKSERAHKSKRTYKTQIGMEVDSYMSLLP
jgi:hypothetical protein